VPPTRRRPTPRELTVEFVHRFRAPVPFVFAWCTDYSPEDPRIERDRYARRILSRGPRTVVYEDLGDHSGDRRAGWFLNRQTVTLHPPAHWHAESDGNYRTWSIDYRLRALPDGTTEMRFEGTRRATPLEDRPPTLAATRRNLATMWSRFGRALEREYRRGIRR